MKSLMELAESRLERELADGGLQIGHRPGVDPDLFVQSADLRVEGLDLRPDLRRLALGLRQLLPDGGKLLARLVELTLVVACLGRGRAEQGAEQHECEP
jgi:hypothetical protein